MKLFDAVEAAGAALTLKASGTELLKSLKSSDMMKPVGIAAALTTGYGLRVLALKRPSTVITLADRQKASQEVVRSSKDRMFSVGNSTPFREMLDEIAGRIAQGGNFVYYRIMCGPPSIEIFQNLAQIMTRSPNSTIGDTPTLRAGVVSGASFDEIICGNQRLVVTVKNVEGLMVTDIRRAPVIVEHYFSYVQALYTRSTKITTLEDLNRLGHA